MTLDAAVDPVSTGVPRRRADPGSVAPAAAPRARGRWRGLLGLFVSASLLWWTLHDVSLSALGGHLAAARWPLFLSAAALVIVTHGLRAVRWKCTLQPDGRILPVASLFYATAVGTMANNLLPARAGELVRSYAARSLTAAPFSTALASLVVERVMDGIAILALLLVGLVAGDLASAATVGPLTLASLVWGISVVFGLVLAAALAIVAYPEQILRVASLTILRWIPEPLAIRTARILRQFVAGLDALRSGHRTAAILLWSLAIWSINAMAVWLGLAAFGIDVPWTAPLLVQAVIALGVALPSSPGFFGPFEAASRAALALFGVEATRAAAFAVPFHVGVYFVPIVALGLWSLWRTGLDPDLLRVRRGGR